MPALSPFLLQPEFHPRPWGARDLSPIYDKQIEGEPIGEAWLTGDRCRIVGGGPLDGMTLGDAARKYGAALVGAAAPQQDRFPLLLKFLFPREKLSVQVHPDDERARRLGQPCGKTKCWYVLAAEPGAQIGLGLKPGVTREDFERAIRETRAEQLLNWLDIHAGELIYVAAGTVHTIGPGSVLLETQQNSDTTFRLYDYGRPRALHVREGLLALQPQTQAGKVRPRVSGFVTTLVESPWFVVKKQSVRGGFSQRHLQTGVAVEVLVSLQGAGRVEAGESKVDFAPGDAVVVPASCPGYDVVVPGELEMIAATLGNPALYPEMQG